jgi:adenylate cyclase
MGTEIERKFLVDRTQWAPGPSARRLRQGYLSIDSERTVRVRLAGDAAWLTIKGRTHGISRLEFEFPVPAEDARQMLEHLCIRPIIDKTRHVAHYAGHDWEIDEFHGANAGLVLAEIELAAPDEIFARPPWLGAEVSDDPRYFNACLVNRPFSLW